MPKNTTLFVGLDDHKDSISVAYAPGSQREEPTFLVAHRHPSGRHRVRNLHSKASRLVFAYEAGPCGYVLHRYLTSKGLECPVVAPSLIPRKGRRPRQDRPPRRPPTGLVRFNPSLGSVSR